MSELVAKPITVRGIGGFHEGRHDSKPPPSSRGAPLGANPESRGDGLEIPGSCCAGPGMTEAIVRVRAPGREIAVHARGCRGLEERRTRLPRAPSGLAG